MRNTRDTLVAFCLLPTVSVEDYKNNEINFIDSHVLD